MPNLQNLRILHLLMTRSTLVHHHLKQQFAKYDIHKNIRKEQQNENTKDKNRQRHNNSAG